MVSVCLVCAKISGIFLILYIAVRVRPIYAKHAVFVQ